MKKRFLTFILTIATMLMCIFGFSACGGNVEFAINFVVENEVYATVSTSGNEVISMPENPTKDDYTFDGWYWDENTWEKPFTANSLLDAPLSSDMKVYAKFNKNHTHEYTPTTTEPTCTEKGLITYTCSCGYSYTEDIPATGVHTWDKGEETKAPTCTKEGETTYTCTVCKTATKTEPIDKLPHEHNTEKWTSNATYHWHECKCGDKDGEEKHTAGAPATATTPQTCTVCGYVLQAETGILFNTLTVEGTKVYGKVSNDTEIFSFINEITVKGNATYVIDVNMSCNDPIESKTVELSVGDNKFYVLEKIGNDVKLFTVTIRRRPMHEVTFDVDGGTAVEKQVIEEDYLATEPETTRTGYTFMGWDYDFTQPITENTKITASWSANTDTKYTVNYYLQNLDDSNYTLHESVELKGETDTTATADIKEYTHFTFNQGYYYNKVSGNINPDGGQVLSVYYTRETYSIVANNNNAKAGTSTQINSTYKYDKEFTLTAQTNTGYTWLGWYDGETCVCEDEEFTFNAEKNVTYTATWSTNVYDITYELNGGENHENNPDTYTIETATITLQTPTRTGYTFGGWFAEETFENKVTEITLGSYGHKMFYAKWTPTEYTVTYHHNDVVVKEITNNSYTITNNSSSRWTESSGVLQSTNKTDSSSSVYKIVANENIIVSFEYKVSSEKNFDKLIIAKNGTALETVSGSTSYVAYSVTLNAGEYLTFTYSKDGSQKSGDDCAYIKNLTYAPNCEVEKITTQAYNIETPTFALITPTRAGYTFGGWFTEDMFENQVTEIPVGLYGDRVYYAKWTAHTDTKYTVNYYLQNLENDNYTLYETVELAGTTDTTATAEIKGYEHFTYNENVSTISGNIDGNGNLVLSIYYTRNKYMVAATGGALTLSGAYKYGTEITSTATPYLGYEFSGWYSGETLLSNELTYTFIAIQDVTAQFVVKAEMSNFNFTSAVTTCQVTSIVDKTVTEIVVPNYVTSISKGAFSGCSSLESITIPFVGGSRKTASNTYQYPFGYIFGTSSYTGGTKTTQYYYGSSTSSTTSTTYYIPTSLKSVTITGGDILYGAFYDCDSLTSVVIPDSVTSIGDNAFYACDSLTSVVIGDSVTSIGSSAFYNCDSLTSVVIGDSVTSIGSYAFKSCYKLVEVVNKSTHITVAKGSSSNGYVGYYALAVYNSGDVFTSKLSNDNGYIIYTYGNNKILVGYNGIETDLVLPSYITKINQYAFAYCNSLTNVVIGDNVTTIGDYAFAYCDNLTSVVIGDSVTSIGDRAFYSCSSLTSVVIPDSVTSIGEYAFYSCSSLTSVEIGDIVTTIGDYAFASCDNLTSVVIGDSVTSIGCRAFSYCSSLTSVVIPDSVTSIGTYAFYGCDSLTSITFKDTSTWYRTTSISDWSNKKGGTSTSVTNSSTNATNFKSTYDDYYWYKK